MTELVVPGVPSPPPPETLLRTRCERCVERGDRYRAWASGRGTIEEIREAVDALANADAVGLPFGRLITLGHGRHKVTVCPRCTNVGTRDRPVPLIERYPRMGREERRKFRLR